MAIASHPPTESSHRSQPSDDPALRGLEAPGVRPAALLAALAVGGATWYGLLVVVRSLV